MIRDKKNKKGSRKREKKSSKNMGATVTRQPMVWNFGEPWTLFGFVDPLHALGKTPDGRLFSIYLSRDNAQDFYDAYLPVEGEPDIVYNYTGPRHLLPSRATSITAHGSVDDPDDIDDYDDDNTEDPPSNE